MFPKLLLPILLLGFSILKYLLDYKCSDKRTGRFKILNRTFLCVIIIAGILTIVNVVSDEISSKRLNDEVTNLREDVQILSSNLEPLYRKAQELFPEMPREKSLQKLIDKVDKIEKTTHNLQDTISDFQIRLEMTFSGDWSSKITSEQVMNPPNEPYVWFIHANNKNKDIECYPTLIRTELGGSEKLLKIIILGVVRPGDWLLGKLISELSEYNSLEFAAAMIDSNKVRNPYIYLEKFNLSIFINGVEQINYYRNPHVEVLVPEKGWRIVGMRENDILGKIRNSNEK